MANNSNDFELFKDEFQKWQKALGLTCYKVYFRQEPLDGSYATITVNQPEWVTTVRYNSKHSEDSNPFLDIKGSAKHEAIHLLLSKFEYMANSRFTTEQQLDEEIESLVHRIEKVVDNVKE